jgi:hypothetical protein
VNYATGDVLSATNMNDLSGTVNLLESAQYAAGKNKIINGDFSVWQRGTSFTNPAINAYTADRWYVAKDGSGATVTVSQQTFTPGTAPVAGYEGQFFFRYAQSVAGTGATYNVIAQKIEDVRTLAGQTVTVSFWAKASASLTLVSIDFSQDFGSGGSSAVNFAITTPPTFTTSWVRYSYSVNVPSITGKTIGTSSSLGLRIFLPNNAIQTLDIWGVQIEASSVASPFQTATGTKQGELAACQRYYYRAGVGTTGVGSATTGMVAPSAFSQTTTTAVLAMQFPVTMRVEPSAIEFSSIAFRQSDGASFAMSAAAMAVPTASAAQVYATVSGVTANRPGYIEKNGTTAGYVAFIAEL